jgi:tripartite-type tricarboxylate transporter receptor subunit TctC
MGVMRNALALLLLLLVSPALAQNYPARLVEIVVPFAAGGGTDLIARVLTERLSETLRQRFVIINRPGASTNIGTAAVANAPADGYTLLLTSISLAANPSLYRKLAFDPQRDLAPIALIANSPSILVVNPSLPVSSLGELIAHLKARPGELNYASYGAGSGPHLAAGLLQDVTGTKMQHVPYGGGNPATMGVLRGEVQLLLAGSLAVLPLIQSGGLSRRSASRPSSAPRRCPTCRPSASRGSTTSPARGSGCWRRPRHRPRSLRCSIARCWRHCVAKRCVRASPSRVPTWPTARRKTLRAS